MQRTRVQRRREIIGVRIEKDLLAQVDSWASRYRMSRSQALRSLVAIGIQESGS